MKSFGHVLPALLSTLFVLIVVGCNGSRTEFETTAASSWSAVQSGKVKEAVTAYESQAREAEQKANTSIFAKQFWETATENYKYASRAARESGDFQRSIIFGEKALLTAERTQEPRYLLGAILELVWAYGSVRSYEKADEFLQRGFEILKAVPLNTNVRDNWEGILNDELGRALMRKQEFLKAVEAYSAAISGNRNWMSWLRPNSPSMAIARHNIILILDRMGIAYRRAGKVDQAAAQYQQAFESIKEWDLKYPYEGSLHAGVGEISIQQKDFPKALENYQKALVLAESQRRPAAIQSASTRIAYIYRQMGNPKEAIPHYRRATDQIESIRSRLGSPEYRQSYFEGVVDVYAGAIVAHLAAKNGREAFNYSERARSRAFLDVVGTRTRLSKAKSQLVAEERALNERIAAVRGRLMPGEDQSETDAVLRNELREAERAYNDFLTKVNKEDEEQASLMSVKPLNAKQVQARLDPGTTLISYFVTGDFVRTWVIEKEKFQYVGIRLSKKELSSLVKELRDNISTLGERKKLDQVSQSLHKSLMEPLLPHITGKELIIVPHDVLHYLPFQALLGSDGRYLIEKYPISYLSSASLLQFTKEKRRAMGDRVLAFGNPDLNDPKMSLQYAGIEAKEIKILYPQSTVYLEKEATEEKAKSLSPQNDIIHFASHAELNENDPLSSAVLLAKSDKEDGRLEVREIFGMNLKASLVVLSACETGLGKLSSGDELVGLTRAFIYAGTPSVVASLWSVEDSSTAQLMASFYKNLKTMTKVEALRQAQLQLIRGNVNSDLLARRGIGGIGKLGEVPTVKPASDSISNSPPASVSTSHPYFWAPFILVGEGK